MHSLTVSRVALVALAICVSAGSISAQENQSIPDRLQHTEQLVCRVRSGWRDLNLIYKAVKQLNEILTLDPQTTFRTQIEYDLDWLNEIVASHHLHLATFYMERGRGLDGARSRLREITQMYPKFSKMDEVLFRLASVALKQDRADEAARYVNTLACKYPASEFLPRAVTELGISPSADCENPSSIRESRANTFLKILYIS